jgi:proteasome assembly chaperone (PAC2) family protein
VSNLVWSDRPSLRDPVLVCAFRGWNDGGQAATLAAGFLRERLGGKPLCEIDPEEFYDFQEVRPHVSLVDGTLRRIEWPENRIQWASLPGAERDMLVLLGIEPQNRWKTYCSAVVEAARESGCSLVITLGGLLADTPHTRPVPVTGSADTDMAQQLGLQPSRYEGPTGIVGVLHDHCKTAGLQSCSLWAAVPHYIGVTPNPKAALALLDRLGGLLGTRFEAMELSQAALAFERQVGRAVSADEDVSRYVRELEQRADDGDDDVIADEGEDDAYGNLPSGEDIARRFEQFLAEQSDEDDEKP